METIYIETTIVSYLVANPSRDSLVAAHQQLTRQWWQNHRQRYESVTSSEVVREASLGDVEMSRRRAEAMAETSEEWETGKTYLNMENQNPALSSKC